MSLTLLTAPGSAFLDRARVKQHLRVDHADEDGLIDGYIAAVTKMLDGADGILGRALVQQSWRLALDGFPCPDARRLRLRGARANAIYLPLKPLISVDQVSYIDPDTGDSIVLADTEYRLLASSDAAIVPVFGKQWPVARAEPESVLVDFTCGYEPTTASPPDAAGNVPEPIKQAALLIVGQWYDNRAVDEEIPKGAQNLLAPYRNWRQ